jgi:hypothetical protein
MLDPDEKEAEAVFDRVVRCLDLCREGTQADIETGTAERMARAMLDYMKDRKASNVPRPTLLSDDANNEDQGPAAVAQGVRGAPAVRREPLPRLPRRGRRDRALDRQLLDGVVLRRDRRRGGAQREGERGRRSCGPRDPAGGNAGRTPTPQGQPSGGGAAGAAGAAGGGRVDTGGYAVNVNTAPVAVLKSLFDDRDLHPRFWDNVIEYRNLEEREARGPGRGAGAPLDEFGEPIIDRKIFGHARRALRGRRLRRRARRRAGRGSTSC